MPVYTRPPGPDARLDQGRVRFAPQEGVRQPYRSPKSYRRSDSRIREDVAERIMRTERIDSGDVTVEVRDGRVELGGTVPNRWMKYSLEDLAADCRGVQEVENRIRVRRRDDE